MLDTLNSIFEPKQCGNLTHKLRSDAQIAVIEKNERFVTDKDYILKNFKSRINNFFHHYLIKY